MLKNLKNYLVVGLGIFILGVASYFYLPKSVQVFDDKFRDLMFVFRGAQPPSKDVVIVDIDERSLKELGQWPWSRNKFAKLIDNLTKSGVGDTYHARGGNLRQVRVHLPGKATHLPGNLFGQG